MVAIREARMFHEHIVEAEILGNIMPITSMTNLVVLLDLPRHPKTLRIQRLSQTTEVALLQQLSDYEFNPKQTDTSNAIAGTHECKL